MTAPPLGLHDRLRRRAAVVSRVLGGQAVVVVIDRRMTHELNAVGTRVWERLEAAEGGCTVGSLVEHVRAGFGIDAETAERDVVRFLEELRALGALELLESP
jgi:hypothetical protein